MADVRIVPGPSNTIRVFAVVNGHNVYKVLSSSLSDFEISAEILAELESDLNEDQLNLAKKAESVKRNLRFAEIPEEID